jgi:hypothetical protein
MKDFKNSIYASTDEASFQAWLKTMETEISKVLTTYNIDQAADELLEVYEQNMRYANLDPKKLSKGSAELLAGLFEQTLYQTASGYNPVELKKKELS